MVYYLRFFWRDILLNKFCIVVVDFVKVLLWIYKDFVYFLNNNNNFLKGW